MAHRSLEQVLGAYPADASDFWTPPDFWDADDLALGLEDHPSVWTDGSREDYPIGGVEVADPTASAARKVSQRRRASGAAEARQRRDKYRRRVRRHTKRSMWREIWGQAPARRSMWACCTNTDNDALLLLGHAIVPPVLLSRLSAPDELSLALTCRFALDIFTMIQEDHPEASDDHTLLDLGLEDLA